MIKEEVKESPKNQVALQNGENKKTDASLSLTVVDSIREFEQLADEWNSLTSVANSYIFESFEWHRIWWKHFGDSKQLHIVLFHDKNTLVGIAPLFLDTFTLGGVELYSNLRFIGSTVSQPEGEELLGLQPYSDYLDFIIHPDYEEEVCSAFVTYFTSGRIEADELILDEVPEKSVLWDNLVPKLSKKDIQYNVEESSGCPIIKLGCSWDEHLSSLSKSSRYRTRRYVKKATKPDYKIFEVEEAQNMNEVNQAYDLLVELHQERWKQLGFPGTFGEQRMYDFFKEITGIFFKKGWSELKQIRALEDDNKCVAVDLIFKYKSRTYLVHRALDASSPSVEESPGNVLLYMMVKKAADEGKEEFDLLRGTESYKFRSANDVITNRRIKIKNPLKERSGKADKIQQLVELKRRTRLEAKQLQVFLNHDGSLLENLKDYGNFVYDRLSRKFGNEEN